MQFIFIGVAIVLWLVAVLYLGVKTMYERLDQTGFKWTIASCIFLVLTFALMLYGIAEDEKSCESVGGEYQVVDREYSVVHKRTVNVYGCVK